MRDDRRTDHGLSAIHALREPFGLGRHPAVGSLRLEGKETAREALPRPAPARSRKRGCTPSACSGIMASLMRPAVTLLLLLALPFHALTAVYLDLRGPAHFHLDDEMHEHSHGHDHPERHHHHAGDPTVVTVEDDARLESLALEESTASGWSATMCVALVSAGASLHLPRLPNDIAPGREPLLQTRFLGRLERPPRIDRV